MEDDEIDKIMAMLAKMGLKGFLVPEDVTREEIEAICEKLESTERTDN